MDRRSSSILVRFRFTLDRGGSATARTPAMAISVVFRLRLYRFARA
jgi:hypothetical protein